MSGRGKQDNAPNTRHPERPQRKPSRLDQFADYLDDDREELAEELDVTSKAGHRRMRAMTRKSK